MLILRMNSAGLKQKGILQRAEMTQPLDLASSCHQVLVEVLGPLYTDGMKVQLRMRVDSGASVH